MNGFLLGGFSRKSNIEHFDFIEYLYFPETAQPCVLLKSEAQDDLSYRILCYSSDTHKLFIKNDSAYLVLCLGTYLENQHDLAETVKNFYTSGNISKIKEINGIFSTLIIDKTNNKIGLFTDRLGTIPIYYHISADTIFFSTELKGILAYPFFVPKINQVILFELFHAGLIHTPDTLIEGISSIGTTNALFYNGKMTLQNTVSSPCKDPDFKPSTNTMLDHLTTAIEKNIKGNKEIAVMCSGGFDSSLITALLNRVTDKKINLFTLVTDKSNDEYQNTFRLQGLFNSQNYYFQPTSLNFLTHIQDSIWRGESEAVGTLSVNIALEYAFTKFTEHATTVFTGDAYMTTPGNAKQSPAFYAHNYGILDLEMTKYLLQNKHATMLHYFTKIKKIIYADDKYISHKRNRLETRALVIGVINGKIRMSVNRRQQFQFPFMDADFIHYIDQIQFNIPQEGDYRSLMNKMTETHHLLPPHTLLNTKSWMPSLMNSLDQLGILNDFINIIQAPTSLCKTLFGDKIATVLQTLALAQKHKFIMTLYYLEIFHDLFIIQQNKILNKLKSKLQIQFCVKIEDCKNEAI